MAKLSFYGQISQRLPEPVAGMKISVGPSFVQVTFSGLSAYFGGDFVGAYDGAGASGNIYSVRLQTSTGSVTADGVNIPLKAALDIIQSRDLSHLIKGITAGNDAVGYGDKFRFGGAGNDTFDEGYQEITFGGDGIDTIEVHSSAKHFTISQTDAGTIVEAYWGTKKTLVGIELVKFDDLTLSVSPKSPFYDGLAAAREAILRQTATAIDLFSDGQLGSRSSAISSLITQAEDSTLPAIISYQEIMGNTPTSVKLDSLAAFVNGQIKSPGYQATANPRLGGYEAMGLGLSGTPEFAAKFGGGSETDLIRTEYQHAFGRAATQAQVDHFVGQIDYFEGLYVGAGISHADAAVKARGAAIGQMLGFAAAEKADIHDAAVAFLMKAADGTAVFGSALDMM